MMKAAILPHSLGLPVVCSVGNSTELRWMRQKLNSGKSIRRMWSNLCSPVKERNNKRNNGRIQSITCTNRDHSDKNITWGAGFGSEQARSCLAGFIGLAAGLIVTSVAPESLALTDRQGPFPCEDVGSYYSQTEGLSGAALKARLHDIINGHKTFSYAQVWDALKLLDAAEESSPESSPEVVEIYTRQRVLKDLAAKPEGWNREHLWPRSYGLVLGQPEFTDLHNLRPADVNVNSSRGNKLFGECSPSGSSGCLVPANREAAPDTATDRQIWMPPGEVRGDIARALLYMAVRYDGSSPGSMDLELSDEPSIAEGRMGLLSVLLRWNATDYPSSTEKLRNERVCSMFQHNRNPFVDHPEYVNLIWGGSAPPLQGVSLFSPNLPAWINEFHYDNNGVDKGEFVEVVVAPNTDPQRLSVLLYNGKDGKVYGNLPLSSFAPGQTTLTGYKVFAKYLPSGGLQNGPSDGLALVQDNTVLQFLSYEGVLTAKEGLAAGLGSTDIQVQESDSTPSNSSLGLTGIGRNYADFKWSVQENASFGVLNGGQILY